jgi:ferritin
MPKRDLKESEVVNQIGMLSSNTDEQNDYETIKFIKIRINSERETGG